MKGCGCREVSSLTGPCHFLPRSGGWETIQIAWGVQDLHRLVYGSAIWEGREVNQAWRCWPLHLRRQDWKIFRLVYQVLCIAAGLLERQEKEGGWAHRPCDAISIGISTLLYHGARRCFSLRWQRRTREALRTKPPSNISEENFEFERDSDAHVYLPLPLKLLQRIDDR